MSRILGCGDLWLTEYEITYEGGTFYTISIMEFRDGKVCRETQYFAPPFLAPGWRQHLVERIEEAAPNQAEVSFTGREK